MPRTIIPMPRTIAGARTLASTRQIVRDFGTCLNFAGGSSTDNVAFADTSSLDLVNRLTIAAWIKPLSFGPSNTGRIVSKTSGVNNEYALFFNGTTRALRCFLGSTDITGTTNSIPVLGKYYHVVLTFDKDLGSNQVKFYVNAVAAGVGTKTIGIGTNNESLYIGNNSTLTRSVEGMMDEVRVYNRALTATEVSNLFYGLDVPTSGLVLYTKFDEGSGSSAVDSSGTQADGVITGATYSTDVFVKPRTTA